MGICITRMCTDTWGDAEYVCGLRWIVHCCVVSGLQEGLHNWLFAAAITKVPCMSNDLIVV